MVREFLAEFLGKIIILSQLCKIVLREENISLYRDICVGGVWHSLNSSVSFVSEDKRQLLDN